MNLPRPDAMRRGPRVESGRAARNAAELTVLLLDEDPGRLRGRARDLERQGVGRVREASDPMQALDILRSETVDALVTAGNLSFVRFLRSSPDMHEAHIPIVMVSGYGRITDVVAARDAGIDDVVDAAAARDLVRHIVDAVFEQRPFVRTKSYAGPDRRAGLAAHPEEEEEKTVSAPLLSQAEIQALLGG